MGLEWLALLMFVVFFMMIVIGYPVAFSFAATSILFMILGVSIGAFDLNLLRLLPNRWFGTMSNFTLLAIIFFVFMGAILEKSGLAERLLTAVGMLMGPLRGGLALAVIIVGTMLAAATGVVAATVIVMGLLSLPVMVRYGYDHKVATGIIVASGTMAQLLPPSLVLVILSDQIGVGVGDLFLGAVIPGLMLSGMYIIYILILAVVQPKKVPALPPEARTLRGKALAKEAVIAIVPTVILIFTVLGSIFTGFATPTEAGAVGAVGSLILAWTNGNVNWELIKNSARATVVITSMVIMILFASTLFGLVFDNLGGKAYVTHLLTTLPGGFWTFIIVSNIIVFIMGMNLEFIEISFIVMPLFVPAAAALGVDMVWFGIMMGINLNIAFISPPVGFSLFYLQGVAPPEVKTSEIHKGAFPFMAIQSLALIIVMLFPQTVLWLVNSIGPA